MTLLADIKEALLQLAFPHVCEGCGSDVLQQDQALCLRCLTELPATQFQQHAGNPVEAKFWGRLPLECGTAHFYFTKDSVMQRLMHAFKYRRNRELGFYLGTIMGEALAAAQRFDSIDCLVPLPLFPAKEKKRGYNQATVLCEGMATRLHKPVLTEAVSRNQFTESQTKKNRVERWHNMEGRFDISNPQALAGRHVLLVDDVVTTGATLEACGQAILSVPDTRLSVATLCLADG